MKPDSKLVVVLMLVALIFLCSFMAYTTAPVKTTGTIKMVQPCAAPWCALYDAHYAQEVNLPNSESNLNNAKGELYSARADLTRAQAQEANQVAWQFAQIGLFGGCLLGLFLVVLGVFVFVVFIRE